MASIGEVTFGQIVDGAGRYKPVAATVAAVAVAFSFIPRIDGQRAEQTAAAAFAASGDPTPPGATPGAPAVTAPDVPVPPASPAFDAGGDVSGFTPTVPDDAGTGSSDFASSDSAVVTADGEVVADSSSSSEPLTITAAAYASATAGTPLAANGVPAGRLPVGTRLGRNDKSSFIMLSGSSTTLVLATDPAGARAAETAKVQACAITTSDWEEGEAKSFSSAPKWNPERCAEGTRADDGSWTFSLADVDTTNGIALVPGAGAPLDSQVAFIRG